jgi:hypothetical protein
MFDMLLVSGIWTIDYNLFYSEEAYIESKHYRVTPFE